SHGGAGPPAGKLVPGSGTSGWQGMPPLTPTFGSLRLSSMVPSQSSSTPLHISVDGPTVCSQVSPFGPGPRTTMPAPFFSHWYCALHGPLVATPPEVQFASRPATSSVLPLQSSSAPLHTSVDFATPPTQVC